MSYHLFLIMMSQLASKKEASILIQESLVFIELFKRDRWKIRTKIFDGEGYIPPSVRSCVSSAGYLRWQSEGPYLRLDPLSNTVVLIQEIERTGGKYIPFRQEMNAFIHVAEEWKEILGGLAEKDHVFSRL